MSARLEQLSWAIELLVVVLVWYCGINRRRPSRKHFPSHLFMLTVSSSVTTQQRNNKSQKKPLAKSILVLQLRVALGNAKRAGG